LENYSQHYVKNWTPYGSGHGLSHHPEQWPTRRPCGNRIDNRICVDPEVMVKIADLSCLSKSIDTKRPLSVSKKPKEENLDDLGQADPMLHIWVFLEGLGN